MLHLGRRHIQEGKVRRAVAHYADPGIDLSGVWQYENRGREPRPSLHPITEALVPEDQALARQALVSRRARAQAA